MNRFLFGIPPVRVARRIEAPLFSGLLAISLLFTYRAAASQAAGQPATLVATVTFSLNFPHSNPENYSIVVDSLGHGHYESLEPAAEGAEPDTYRSEFGVSPETQEKIFAWAQAAHYFSGNVDSGNHKIAFTGAKVLTYRDDRQNNTARYDYSNLAPVRQLTALFQGMAATLEYGRRLSYDHRYQKLALDDELKHMEEAAKDNELSEIRAVAPVLQELVDDDSVLNVVRVRAKQLLEAGSRSAAAGGQNAH